MAAAKPALPSPTVSTAMPASSRPWAMLAASSGSSSTTRIRIRLGSPVGAIVSQADETGRRSSRPESLRRKPERNLNPRARRPAATFRFDSLSRRRVRSVIRHSRRNVLIGALAAGAGVGVARLASSRASVPTAPAKASSNHPAWAQPGDPERARIAQLLRRTTFGVTAAEVDAAAGEGFNRTLERLIETPLVEPPNLVKADDPTRGARLGAEDLQRWSLAHLLGSPNRFAERMTYFWHGQIG